MNLRKDQLYEISINKTAHGCDAELICSGAYETLACAELFCAGANLFDAIIYKFYFSFLQLLAMDVSAQATMKDAAKCDKLCEWQNSANQ